MTIQGNLNRTNKYFPQIDHPLTRFFRTLGHKYRSKQRSKTSLTALSYAGILLKDVYLIKLTLIRCLRLNNQTRETKTDIYYTKSHLALPSRNKLRTIFLKHQLIRINLFLCWDVF